MKKTEYITKGLVHAFGVFIYVSTIAFFITNSKSLFGEIPEPHLFIPVFMLLLFIISATTTSLLVLGKPISLYIDGFKKEAFVLLFITLAWLVFFLMIAGSAILFL